MTKFPHKKLITMTRTEDLLATLSAGEPAEPDATPLAQFNITGVAAAYARLQKDETRTVLSKPKVGSRAARRPRAAAPAHPPLSPPPAGRRHLRALLVGPHRREQGRDVAGDARAV